MEKNIQDKDLGVITLRTTPRATRYTLKISKGKITATMPPGGDEKRMIAFIMENKARLVKALQKHPARPLLDERSELQATTFRLHIFRTERSNFWDWRMEYCISLVRMRLVSRRKRCNPYWNPCWRRRSATRRNGCCRNVSRYWLDNMDLCWPGWKSIIAKRIGEVVQWRRALTSRNH